MAEPIEPHTNTTPTQQPATPTPPVSGPLSAVEAKLYDLLVYKAPFQLPTKLTDFIVTYGPWITLVLGLLFLPVFFAAIAALSVIGTVATSVYGAYVQQPTALYWLALLVLIVQVIIMFVSVPKLLKRQRSGWQLLFYANAINIGYSILNAFGYGYFNFGSLLLSLISVTISLYVLFQIRHYYVK